MVVTRMWGLGGGGGVDRGFGNAGQRWGSHVHLVIIVNNTVSCTSKLLQIFF